MNLPSTVSLLLLMALSGPVKAQRVWHKGEITLVTSIRLTGEFYAYSRRSSSSVSVRGPVS